MCPKITQDKNFIKFWEFPVPKTTEAWKLTIFCKSWKRWSVSCYTDRLLIGGTAGPYQLSSNNKYEVLSYFSDRFQFYISLHIATCWIDIYRKQRKGLQELELKRSIEYVGAFLVDWLVTACSLNGQLNCTKNDRETGGWIFSDISLARKNKKKSKI